MNCPYCNKKNFVPEVVYLHTESYGEGIKRFRCLHCEKVVQCVARVRVLITDIGKTDEESDW